MTLACVVAVFSYIHFPVCFLCHLFRCCLFYLSTLPIYQLQSLSDALFSPASFIGVFVCVFVVQVSST